MRSVGHVTAFHLLTADNDVLRRRSTDVDCRRYSLNAVTRIQLAYEQRGGGQMWVADDSNERRPRDVLVQVRSEPGIPIVRNEVHLQPDRARPDHEREQDWPNELCGKRQMAASRLIEQPLAPESERDDDGGDEEIEELLFQRPDGDAEPDDRVRAQRPKRDDSIPLVSVKHHEW